jgi:hypothetical protein
VGRRDHESGMQRVAQFAWIAIAIALLLNAGTASALTICVGACESITEPLPPITVVDPLDLPDFSTTDVSGLVLAGGDALGPYNVTGDVILHVPSGSLIADVIDLRAGGGILDVQVSLVMADSINFCTIACVPFETEIPGFAADPFHLVVLGPLTGALEVFASGNIFVTAEPIPESSTAFLLAIGFAALAASKPRLFA